MSENVLNYKFNNSVNSIIIKPGMTYILKYIVSLVRQIIIAINNNDNTICVTSLLL